MPNEERDVPPLDVLLSDITQMQERFDAQSKETPDAEARSLLAVSFIQNDMLPWLKDFVESSLFGFEDIQDQIAPIEIPASEAENMVEILEATKQSNVGNVLLTERIDRALAVLKPVDDDEDEEDEDEETN